MTQVMNTCESTVGGASGEDAVALKVWVPSIVVEPTDGGQVESGELRWPPDDVSSDIREDHAQVYLWRRQSQKSRDWAGFKTSAGRGFFFSQSV